MARRWGDDWPARLRWKQDALSTDDTDFSINPQGIATPATPSADLQKFLSMVYKSDLMAETEANFRRAAEGYKQGDERDGVLIKVLSAGLLSATYENMWAQIYRSQLRLLEALNQRARTVNEAKEFYDDAVAQHPDQYQHYSFEQWLSWLRTKVLILQDGMTVGITVAGKDFLKYLVHAGWSADMRTF